MVKAALLDLRLGPLGGDTLGNKGGAWTGLEVRDRHTHTHTRPTSLPSPHLGSVSGLVLCQLRLLPGLRAVGSWPDTGTCAATRGARREGVHL